MGIGGGAIPTETPTAISAARAALGAAKLTRASSPTTISPDINIAVDRSNCPWFDDRVPDPFVL